MEFMPICKRYPRAYENDLAFGGPTSSKGDLSCDSAKNPCVIAIMCINYTL